MQVQEAMQSLSRLEAGMNQRWEQAKMQTASVFRQFETEVMVRRGEIERGMVLAQSKERALLAGRMVREFGMELLPPPVCVHAAQLPRHRRRG